jgi:MFS transporter, DHA1 family, tetracycline resistance protein
MTDQRLQRLLPLFAAVFIDIFSFGLMYPVIVALFHHPIVIGVYRPAMRDAYLSLAFSLFPLGMFFGASFLGDLSDAIGRRRTLLICMAGLASAYALMWLAIETRELLVFLAGRLLSGLMAGTGPIAQAAMMDRSSEAERGRNMANVVLVNCIGLIAGPAMGGVLGHLDFRAPLGVALLLCLVVFLWIRGSHVEEAHVPRKLVMNWRRPIDVFTRALRHRVIGPLSLSFLLFQLGFGLYYVYILVKLRKLYGVTALELGLFSAVMGVGFLIGTTVGYRSAARWLGKDRKVAALGLAACGIFIMLSAAYLPDAAQWIVALCVCTSNVLAFVGLLALISAAASSDEQGWALGIGASMTALAFFLAGLPAATLTLIPLGALLGIGGLIVLAALLPLRAAWRPGVGAPGSTAETRPAA